MNRVFTFVALLFLIASCTSEIDQVNNISGGKPSDSKTVFFASTENTSFPNTKVYADENLKVLWNADDRISIFNKTTFNYQFAFTGDDGDTAGSFEEIPASDFITGADIDNIYAVYPYDKKNKLSNSCVLTVTLPSEQAYKESSFGIGANTMVAASSGNFLAFKNVGGYLNLRLYGDDVSVSRITIKGNNGEKIAGKASIEMPLGGVPTVTMDNSATDEISVVCNPAVKIGADANNYTDFWFVIPPVYFSLGFTITVTDDKGGVFERATSKALTINRNTLEWMAALKVVPDYTNANVQFEDANFKAYCVENFDKDGDGEISIAEARVVTDIEVNTDNITSLGGIEFFVSLRSLICFGSYTNGSQGQLLNLDLSQNTALTLLDCYGNQLSSLDVSHNTALTNLGCGHNKLTSLDVSHNTMLTWLYCSDNQLTSLDVSHNTELTSLSCGSNQLTSLDVSNNPELTHIGCDANQLTSLDIHNNIRLYDINCNTNQIAFLDVSSNLLLTYLSCAENLLTELDLSNNVELSYLHCFTNQLSTLDVSGNTKLNILRCVSNPLLTEIWLMKGQTISTLEYDSEVATIKYKQSALDNNIHFADSAVKAICVANWDTDGDGELSYAEAEVVTNLPAYTPYDSAIFAYNTDITSFDELQYFTGLTEISNTAFMGCSSLQTVTLPPYLTRIGNSAFEDCSSLDAIVFPSSLISIEATAFIRCSRLVFDLPSNVTAIGHSAFYGCKGPQTLDFNGQLGEMAFAQCTNIESANISIDLNDDESYGGYFFDGCSSLVNASVTIGSFFNSSSYPILGTCGNLDTLSIRIPSVLEGMLNGCESIRSLTIHTSGMAESFADFSKLEKVTLRSWNGLGIAEEAFKGCASLKDVSITSDTSGLDINSQAFASCPKLESLTITIMYGYQSYSRCYFATSAFEGCSSLKTVKLQGELVGSDISSKAFKDCSQLESIVIEWNHVPTLSSDALDNTNNCPIYVPLGIVDTYRAADIWKDYASRIQAISE